MMAINIFFEANHASQHRNFITFITHPILEGECRFLWNADKKNFMRTPK